MNLFSDSATLLLFISRRHSMSLKVWRINTEWSCCCSHARTSQVFTFVLDRMGRNKPLYLDNSIDMILVVRITALSAVMRMDKERQTYKHEDETDGEFLKRRGEENTTHRFGGNAWKEVTLGRPRIRCEVNIKIEVGREIWQEFWEWIRLPVDRDKLVPAVNRVR
jgi:hypothetical protein